MFRFVKTKSFYEWYSQWKSYQSKAYVQTSWRWRTHCVLTNNRLIELQNRDINIPNLRKSKDFYRVYTQNPYHGADEEPKLYVEKYCENEQDLYTLAFTKKVKLEKEVKLKEQTMKMTCTWSAHSEPSGDTLISLGSLSPAVHLSCHVAHYWERWNVLTLLIFCWQNCVRMREEWCPQLPTPWGRRVLCHLWPSGWNRQWNVLSWSWSGGHEFEPRWNLGWVGTSVLSRTWTLGGGHSSHIFWRGCSRETVVLEAISAAIFWYWGAICANFFANCTQRC